MKHEKLLKRLSGRWLLCALLTMVSLNLFATDFTFDGIEYYIISEEEKTCITNPGYYIPLYGGVAGNRVTGDLILPSNPNGYTLVRLGACSFFNNKDLLSVTLPESVTSLGEQCFDGCTSLTSVTIPESVTSLGRSCFFGCRSLASVTIPEAVTSLPLGCFQYCTSLASVTIPESVTSLGRWCFYDCNLQPLRLQGRIKSIEEDSFENLNGYIICKEADIDYYRAYTSLLILPYDTRVPFFLSLQPKVCGVEVQLEKNTNGLDRELNEVSLSILSMSSDEPLKTVVPDSVKYLFKDLVANTPYRIELSWTNEKDEEDSYQLSFITKSLKTILNSSSTQTTFSVTSLSVSKDDTFEPSEIGIIFQGEKYPFTGEKLTFKDLFLESKYYVSPYVIYNDGKDEFLGQAIGVETKGWNCTVKATDVNSTSVELSATFTEDDAQADEVMWLFDENMVKGRKATIVSLPPDSTLNAVFVISYAGEMYGYDVDFTTDKLEFTTLNPKCVSNSCAIVAAETNIADVEPNVGFEWRKYDAPPTLPSTVGYGTVCDGMLEGYIKNLQSQSYYNVRPFYKEASGKLHYGEWITFDPSDFSYFEPTIRTYPVQAITENSAMVRGYIMPGTDNITRQGFQYWKTGGNKVRANAPMAEDINTVEVSGQLISATLDNLTPGTGYTFRVFVETTAGYIYGEEQSFTTEGEAPSIETVVRELASEEELPSVAGYYDVFGIYSPKPHNGLNIVVYSDGTSKKIIIK